MCFKHHLEPPEQAKMFQVHSCCKKGQKGNVSPLTLGVHSHDRNAEEKRWSEQKTVLLLARSEMLEMLSLQPLLPQESGLTC